VVILDLSLGETEAGKSQDYSDPIVFKKLRFKTFSSRTKMKSLRFEIPPF